MKRLILISLLFIPGCGACTNLSGSGGLANQPVPQANVHSPLDPGVYSGVMKQTIQTISQGQTSEQRISQIVPIVIGDSGIPVFDGEEVSVGQTTTAELGGGIQMTPQGNKWFSVLFQRAVRLVLNF